MGIYRGTGGTGDSTTDTTVTTVTEKAAEAASSATSAANSATSAANSASSAFTSETNAATSETNAANSATASATSATASETAKTASQAAQTAAETAQANAETAEANAVTAKNQAVSAKDNAVTAQTAAETAETNAETAYANTLAIFGDATDVQDAVDSASASATTATTKAAEAASSATDASNYSSSAGTSATQAASSASQAATSAASANSYATDAQTAQTAAETAQAAAEASEAEIKGLYLGSLADDPTLDGNGVAVTTGDLYFNTTAQEVRVYTDGDVWEPVVDLAGDITVNSLTSNNDVVVKGNLEVQGTTITVDSATAQTIDLGDNDKIRLGDSDDLQLYHDGTHSYIKDVGTGNFFIQGQDYIVLENNSGVNMLTAQSAGAVSLYNAGSVKLATTSTGVDVTGNITVSGTVDGRDIAADGATLDAVASTYVDVSGDTMTGDLAFGDNVKAKFGDSDDLEIYHSGIHSYISDQGTGNLRITANNLNLRNANDTLPYLHANNGDAVFIYHNGSKKFETTSSGVDITGTVVADGATIDGEILVDSATGNHFVKFYRSDSTINAGNALGQIWFGGSDDGDFDDAASIKASAATNWTATSSATQLDFYTTANTTITPAKRLTIEDSGDISFYEDTGTTAKLTWDASAEELQFKDGVKAEFGDGGDLQIYHNGSASFIDDGGTGDLNIRANNLGLRNISGAYYIYCTSGGAVSLRHNNVQKLATTSTGIDVTGTVVADGLAVDGNGDVNGTLEVGTSSSGILNLMRPSTNYLRANEAGASIAVGVRENLRFFTGQGENEFLTNERLRIANNGDISFYDDAGTSQDFYWDASTSRLGLGTTSPLSDIHIAKSAPIIRMQDTDNNAIAQILYNTAGGGLLLRSDVTQATGASGSNIIFETDASEAMRIDSNGRLGLGTTSPNGQLDVRGTSLSDILAKATSANSQARVIVENDARAYSAKINASDLFQIKDETADAARLTIDTSGNVGIGTTSPAEELHISASIPKIQIQDSDGTNQYGQYYHSAGSTSILSRNGNADGQILFQRYDGTTTSESMRIDSSGNLLVGTTAVDIGIGNTYTGVTLNGGSGRINAMRSNGASAYFGRTNSDGTIVDFRKDGTTVGSIGNSGTLTYFDGTGGLIFKEGGLEAARFDTSGNLLVGKTSSGSTGIGVELVPAGAIYAVRSGNLSAVFDRKSSDGQIIQLRKDGNTIGSIGVSSSNLLIDGESDRTGLAFRQFGEITPRRNGALANGTADLGSPSYRFRNLYLSGGVYLGGTGDLNKLDDYETGTWIPTTASDATGAFSSSEGEYTKIGRLVFVSFVVNVSTNFTSNIIGGLPFTVADINSLSSYHQVGTCITQSSNTVTTVAPENSTEIRFFDNQNVNDTHTLNTTQDLYRVTISYQTT